MTEGTAAPTLDELGVSGDVEAILQAAAETVTVPDERWKKESNVVRYGDKKLPERVTVYRRLTGRAVEVPTATVGQTLRKKAPDGGPAFVRNQADALKVQEFIPQECEVCVTAYGKPKRFYSMANYRGHMRIVHEQEWEEMRETAAEERQNRQTEALIALAQKGVTDVTIEEGADHICGTCGQEAKSLAGLKAHERSHADVS